MKNIVFLFLLTIVAVSASTVNAQRETPAGAGDRNLNDNGIKMRSVEMDRVKQDAQRAEAASFAPINSKLSVKFPQIKEDFEGIQLLQDAIIKAYTTGKTIDYRIIESSAEQMNSKGKRLDSNLFADTKKDKEAKPVKEGEKPKTIRDLIVELDNTIGKFVGSKIFANIKVIEPDDAITTRTNLLEIIRLSDLVAIEAKKMK